MSTPLAHGIARLMLAVLLISFLSPAVAQGVAGVDHHLAAHGHDATHAEHADQHHHHGHALDAHSNFGHLLDHLPARTSDTPLLALDCTVIFTPPEVAMSLLTSTPALLYRPPRLLLRT
jgi:hypothetical protein